jgi:Ca2+-binding RTX toxin-like protein
MFARSLTATVLATAALSAGPVASPASATQAAAAGQSTRDVRTCLGRPVTMVGKPGKAVAGTRRHDVILTNGATVVRPRAGDDRVCVTNSRGRAVEIFDRDGDDRITVRSSRYRSVEAYLGDGEDVFRGGPGRDLVQAGRQQSTDRERDDIRTGAGDDTVYAGGRSTALDDYIDLGPGDDSADLYAVRMTDSGRLAGGTGTDRLAFNLAFAADVDLDVPRGTVTIGGRTVMRFGGFDDYRVDHAGVLNFTGSGAPERLQSRFGELNADMGAGDDEINVVGSADSDLLGGPGSDTMVISGHDALMIDATTGRAVRDSTSVSTFSSFESLHGVARTLTVLGSDRAETLRAYGCQVVVRAGGGPDVLEALGDRFTSSDLGCDDAPLTSQLYGEDGDDTLLGRRYADTLVGGDGTDTADGRAGIDTCDAESTISCEG